VSIMPVQVYNKCLRHIPLEPSTVHLKSVTGGRVTVIGRVNTPCVKLGNRECHNLKLIVTSNEVVALLLDRNWLRVSCPQWKSVLKELIGVSKHANADCIPICKTGMGHSVQLDQGRMNESNCQSNRQSQNTRQSCKIQSEKYSPPGNVIDLEDNEDCGRAGSYR
jgi:hypothetical protein